MGKYDALGKYLRSERRSEVPMTFADVERITGERLPPSAHRHRPWWSNNPKNSVMTKVWLDAGFATERVDMSAQQLVFRRLEGQRAPRPDEKSPSRASVSQHHPLRGGLKGLVRIMPGTNLTDPADPEWGELWDK